MSVPLRFRIGSLGASEFEADDETWSAFGSFLTSDVQHNPWPLLGILASVEDVRRGQEHAIPLSGNSWTGEITARGVHLEDIYSDDWSGDYTLDQAHTALLLYWHHLLHTPADRAAALRDWEVGRSRTHPCRDHLGVAG